MGKSKYRKQVDWLLIEPDWAAGQLSKAEIGRKHEVTPQAMTKHFGKTGLIYGSLSNSVRLKIDAKLVEQPEEREVTIQVLGAEPEDVVDKAAEVGASVIRSHRKDIASLFSIKVKSEAMLSSIEAPAVEDGLGFDDLPGVKLYIDTADRLVQTTERLINMQRKAFNLDVENADSGNSVADAIREAESCRRK